MPLQPLQVVLTDGQRIEVLKRFRQRYADELTALERDMEEILLALAEADFLVPYLGEQPEIVELRARKADIESKERRRQYLGKIIERIDQIIPQQKPVAPPPPIGAPSAPTGQAAGAPPGAAAARPGLRRY